MTEPAPVRSTDDVRTSRFRIAPYYVWMGMRILGLVGAVMFIGSIWGLLNGSLSVTEAIVIGTAGALIAGDRRPTINDGLDVPLFCEIFGSMLSSKRYPQCGQSVFDQMPATGFELETARHSYWPTRICFGCGGDTTKLAPACQNTRDDKFGS